MKKAAPQPSAAKAPAKARHEPIKVQDSPQRAPETNRLSAGAGPLAPPPALPAGICTCDGGCPRCCWSHPTATGPSESQARHLAESLAASPYLQDWLTMPWGPQQKSITLHTDRQAAEQAKGLNAKAFARGRHIYFGLGQYAPQTQPGRLLLAHELIHVLQQTRHQQALVQRDAGDMEQVEIYVAEHIMVVHYEDEVPDTLRITHIVELDFTRPYELTRREGRNIISTVGGEPRDIVEYIFQNQEQMDRFNTALEERRTPVPVRFRPSSAQTAPVAGEEGGEPLGDRPSPLEPDYSVLANNEELANLLFAFLGRFAGTTPAAALTTDGLTQEEITSIIAAHPATEVIIQYFTQGWHEYQATGNTEMGAYALLQETILVQRRNGNFNALRNNLQISSDRDGLGIFDRRSHIRYYDQNGQPLLGVDGSYRDNGYRAFEVPPLAIELEVTGGLAQVLNAVRQISADQAVQVIQAIQGYMDNADLLWPRVRRGWDGWSDLQEEWRRTMPVLVGFLGAHLVAMVLKQAGHPIARSIGVGIDLALRAASYFFNILFVGELLVLALQCGRELSMVERPEEGTDLDQLSERHIANAVALMRRLIIMAINFGLTVLMVQTARETTIWLGETLPPGGRGPGGTAPAEAVTPEGIRMPVPEAAPEAVPATAMGGGPRVSSGPRAVPISPEMLMEGTEGGGGPGQPGEGPTPRRRRIVRPEPAPEEPAPEAAPPEPAQEAVPARPRSVERPSEFEARMLQEYTAARNPVSRTYFWWRGMARRTLGGFVTALRAHARATGMRLPRLNRTVLRDTVWEFMDRHQDLRQVFDADLAAAQRAIEAQRRVIAEGGNTPYNQARMQALEARYESLMDWALRPVGNKRPDLIELWADRESVMVTDITERPYDPSHNFKTRFYIKVLQEVLGWEDVSGHDFRSTMESTPLE